MAAVGPGGWGFSAVAPPLSDYYEAAVKLASQGLIVKLTAQVKSTALLMRSQKRVERARKERQADIHVCFDIRNRFNPEGSRFPVIAADAFRNIMQTIPTAGIVSLLQLQRQPQASELFCGNAGAVDRQLYGQKGICPAKRKSYGFLPAGKAMYNTVFHQRLQKQL